MFYAAQVGARRGRHEGTIIDLGGGRWRVMVSTPTGRRSKVVKGSKRDAATALAALREVTGPADGGRTMGTLLDEWLKASEGRVAPSTLKRYRHVVDSAVRPALGRLRLAAVDARTLDAFVASVGAERGSTAARSAYDIVGIALRQGVRWGWLTSDALDRRTPPAAIRRDISPPAVDTVARLIEACGADADFALYVGLAAVTGARRGELCGLRWGDVVGRELTIARSIATLDGGELFVKAPKSGRRRRITLAPAWAEALERHREVVRARARACGVRWNDDLYVFSMSGDHVAPMRPDYASHRFNAVMRTAGVAGVRLHDLRHFSVTQLLSAGVDVRTIAERHGHERPDVTLRVYASFVRARDTEAADILGAMVKPQ